MATTLQASDIRALADALGPGGIPLAKRFFPQYDDPSKAFGDVAGTSTTTIKEYGNMVVNRTELTFVSRSLTMTDEAGVVAYGGTKVYDFPAGLIKIFGAVANLTVLKSGAGINTDFDGDFGVGTVTAGNNNALATTEQNIIPTTPTAQAVAGATTAVGLTAADIVVIDGTTTPVDLYLNFLIDDADQDGGGALLISGTLTFTWLNLGDK